MWPTKKTCQDVCDIMWPHLNAPSGHFTRMTLAIHIRQKWMSDGLWVKPLSFKIHQIIIYWLVVWNMTFMTFHILGVIIPTDFHIFQRGRYTTNRYIHIYIYIHPLITPLDYMLSAKLKYQRIFRDPASERGRRIQIIIKARCSPWWRNCGCRNGEKHGIRQEQPTSIIKHKNQQHAFKMIVQDDSISKNI